MSQNVCIDADVMIASEIESESNHKSSKEFMDKVIENGNEDFTFFTSLFTFVELASAMKRRTKDKDKAYSLLYRTKNTWKKYINPLPLLRSKNKKTSQTFSINLVDELIEMAIKYETKSGDTIQSKAIAENQIDYFVTWNKKDFALIEKTLPGLKIVTPKEMIEIIEKDKKKPKEKETSPKTIPKKKGAFAKILEYLES